MIRGIGCWVKLETGEKSRWKLTNDVFYKRANRNPLNVTEFVCDRSIERREKRI